MGPEVVSIPQKVQRVIKEATRELSPTEVSSEVYKEAAEGIGFRTVTRIGVFGWEYDLKSSLPGNSEDLAAVLTEVLQRSAKGSRRASLYTVPHGKRKFVIHSGSISCRRY